MKKFIKENYSSVVILLVFLSLSFIIGYITNIATYAITVSGNNITYNNSKTGIESTTVNGALNELYTAKQANCLPGYICLYPKTTLALGDYVYYVPSATTATTNPNYTGYRTTDAGNYTASVQTYNPSELKLWRVIKINSDGSAEIISQYVSSTNINFNGLQGYKNYIYELNRLAGAYETSGITSGHRHFGYSNQTQQITNTSKFTTTAPWTCGTGGSCNPVESQGGGDTGYETDTNLVKTAFAESSNSALLTVRPNGTHADNYWIASRTYYYATSSSYYWGGRTINNNNSNIEAIYLYKCVRSSSVVSVSTSSGTSSSTVYYNTLSNVEAAGYPIRPIVKLKAGLKYLGFGTYDEPMKIVG